MGTSDRVALPLTETFAEIDIYATYGPVIQAMRNIPEKEKPYALVENKPDAKPELTSDNLPQHDTNK